MEKRLLVAIFLSFLVLYGYQVFVLKPASDAAKARTPAAAQSSAPAGQKGAARAEAPAAAAPPEAGVEQATAVAAPAAAAAGAQQVRPSVSEASERDIVVDTRSVRAVFSNRGARLKSWRLKAYLDLEKRPQELVPTYLPASAARPFDLQVDDAAVTGRLREALFRVSGVDDGHVDGTRGPATVTFEYAEESGLVARKVFVFAPSSYVVKLHVDVAVGERAFNPTVLWGPGLGDQVPGAETSRYVQKPEGIIVRGDKVQRLAAKELYGQPVQEGEFTAAGVDDHYFIAVVMAARPVRVEYKPVSLAAPAGEDPKRTTDLVAFGVRQARAMSGASFFLGPKDFDVLQGVDRRLVRTINYGMFDWLAVPLLQALKWINRSVGNYGWSIIILTFLINALMFPLRHKSMVSMRKMQDLQPEMKAIQERYGKLKATDPARQKMNTEVMNLYKERGVNPASGCLPMLLTMPVLFAFYSLLSQAIEIRGEPFIFWLQDLSARDPYYVTPVLMGLSQLWQQKMTPSGADPMQQKMMLMMPLVFTFMFLWMPSGLVVYWFFTNLMAIAQQYVTNRVIGPVKVPQGAGRQSKTKGA